MSETGSGSAGKRSKESLSEALSGAAVAIVKEIKKAGESPQSSCPPGPGVSPG